MPNPALSSTPPREQPFISKSKFLWGLQCPKLLWTAYNRKDLIPAPDSATQAIFDQGHEVGALAKQLFPGGIEVSAGVADFQQVLQQSLEAAKTRKPLFEPGFVYNGGFARADILNPVGKDAWDVVEVKSSTQVKDVNLPDLGFQSFVYTGAGLKLRRCVLMHIDGEFARHGPIDARSFFKQEDVTATVSGLSRQVQDQLDEMAKVIRQPTCPDTRIGQHCDDPCTCPLHDQCWEFLPEQSVASLYRGSKKGFKLLEDGITSLTDIPDDFQRTDNQCIQREAAITGKPHVDRPAIAAFLSQLKYPASFLDFETFGTAIPLCDGVKPYQQIPFQFSLHVVGSAGAEPKHFRLLAAGRNDPRPEFMRRLQAVLPETGSVVVYNAAFEQSRLDECCEFLTESKPWNRRLQRRMVDLLLPFRGFRYYHPTQCGSASMKAVLPALTGRGYEGLEIQEGGTASMEFLRVTHGDVTEDERQRVRRQLEDYCGMDTEGMIWIVDELRKIAC
ncbi:MAG: DUF2779 domain-containing protein [Verrucomicrobiia bacterium]